MGSAIFFIVGAVIIGTGLIYLGVMFFHPEAQEWRRGKLEIKIQLESQPGQVVFHIANLTKYEATLCFAPGFAYELMAKTQGDTFKYWQAPERYSKNDLNESYYLNLPASGKIAVPLPFKNENGKLVFANGFYFNESFDEMAAFGFRYDPALAALHRGRKLGFKNLYKGHIEIKDFSCKLAQI
jgi:hypothetical protein